MPNTVGPFEKFKWDVLADVVWEDYQGLWEPLWWLRGGGRIDGQSESERREYAERAIRELYEAGLIYLFAVTPGQSADAINAAGSDPSSILMPPAVDEALRAEWWRQEGGIGNTGLLVWIGATPVGVNAAENAPPAIRDYWRTST